MHLCLVSLVALSLVSLAGRPRSVPAAQDAFDAARERMVDQLAADVGLKNQRVISALRSVPRHLFMPLSQRRQAYEDLSLPIGDGQTISAPWAVAYMTERLDPQPSERVLEIGTGSGYQAAVLSGLVAEVYTIEIVERLGVRAAGTLKRLGYENVHVRVGDGFKGWPEKAPFDKIIVTCSPESVPAPLIEQLAEGGRMLIPVGSRYQQRLYLMEKKNRELVEQELVELVFVPMTGRAEQLRRERPDPANPSLFNGNFELDENRDGQPDGWHYRRGAELGSKDPPEGKIYVTFRNDVPGKDALALQAMALDGRQVRALDLSFWLRVDAVQPGPQEQLPHVVLTFYDERRRSFHYEAVGPWSGTAEWKQIRATLPVPVRSNEAILRIGLLGATGAVSFDDIQLRAVARGGND